MNEPDAMNDATAEATEKNTRRLFIVTTLLLVFIMTARMPVDTDLWWHLRAGETTWNSGFATLTDSLSFTHYGETWINHSWLSQVILYLAFKSLGYWGLTIVVALAATICMGILLYIGKSPLPFRSLLILAGVAVSAPVWSPRPQIFSLLFLAVCQSIFYLFKWQGKRILWVLPVLFAAWSNLHAGFSLGLIFLGCSVLGEAANKIFGYQSGSRPLSWKEILSLGGWTAAGGLSVLLNPNGIGMWKVQFNTVGVQALQQFVTEWASPDFHDLAQQPFLGMLIVMMAVFALSPRKPDATQAIVAAVFTGLALLARRNIGPFAVAALPILDRYGWELSAALWSSFKEWVHSLKPDFLVQKTPLSPGNRASVRGAGAINLMIAGLLMAVAVVKAYAVGYPAAVANTLRDYFPVEAVSTIQAEGIEGNILNEYNWGGYLDWFSRDTRVFIDGRTDLFGDETFKRWVSLIQAEEGWEETLAEYKIDAVLLQPERPLTVQLIRQGWVPEYVDGGAVLLVRK